MNTHALTGLKMNLMFDFPLSLDAAKEGRHPFTAVITYAGRPSDGPVGGTENVPGGPYRVMIPKELMEEKISELIGKNVFAATSLAEHTNAVSLGSYADAWTELVDETVSSAHASGFLVSRDSNKVLIAAIIQNARAGLLGFSYDLKDASGYLDSEVVPGEVIEVLTDFKWRGATILFRTAAAYSNTALAAKKVSSKENESLLSILLQGVNKASSDLTSTSSLKESGHKQSNKEIPEMDEKQLKEFIQKTIGDSLTASMTESLKPVTVLVNGIGERLTKVEAAISPKDDKPITAATVQELIAKGVKDALAATTAPSKDKEIDVKDLVAGITSAMTEANKPVLEALGKLSTPDGKEKGKRLTLSAEEISTVRRFSPTSENPDSPEAVEAAIAAVNAAAIPNSQRGPILDKLSAARRAFRRQEIMVERQNFAMSGGRQ